MTEALNKDERLGQWRYQLRQAKRQAIAEGGRREFRYVRQLVFECSDCTTEEQVGERLDAALRAKHGEVGNIAMILTLIQIGILIWRLLREMGVLGDRDRLKAVIAEEFGDDD